VISYGKFSIFSCYFSSILFSSKFIFGYSKFSRVSNLISGREASTSEKTNILLVSGTTSGIKIFISYIFLLASGLISVS